MDTSETYIKMCEKAEEIQELADKDSSHQFFCCKVCGELASEDTGSYWVDCDCTGSNMELVWLPRQDQLQEMLGFGDLVIATLGFIREFAINEPSVKGDWSLEQITLASVMFKKYNKVWNGEDWV